MGLRLPDVAAEEVWLFGLLDNKWCPISSKATVEADRSDASGLWIGLRLWTTPHVKRCPARLQEA